jgi:hypothetical protein
MGYERKKRKSNKVEVMSKYDYECEEDLRAIARADSVKGDPERMKKVKALAKSKLDESMRKKEEAQKMIELGQETA